MRERPILFSGPMVRAILDGKKTQTRRIVKPQPLTPNPTRWWWPLCGAKFSPAEFDGQLLAPCPYGAPGDRLWVRETCSLMTVEPVAGAVSRSLSTEEARQRTRFAADGTEPYGKWTPAIHMPRWASRLTLEVVSVRVERLNDISEADAQAEGVAPFFEVYKGMGQEQTISTGERAADAPHRASFACLWDEINGDRALWKSNPWVWVVEFKRAEPTPGQTEGGR
jgi:hypothetical protein